MSARDQRREARDILATCTPATWRPLVAWAAGVSVAQHASHFYTLPIPPRGLAPESTGSGDRGRFWDADRSSFRITEYIAPPDGGNIQRAEVLTLRWPEIEGLVTVDLVGAVLHAQIREALGMRRDRTPVRDPRRPSSWRHTAEAERENRLWSEIEAECYELGALAWQRCDPRRRHEQLDLFGVAA